MSLIGPLNLLVRFLCFGRDKDSQKPSRPVCFSIYTVNQLYKQGRTSEPVSWFKAPESMEIKHLAASPCLSSPPSPVEWEWKSKYNLDVELRTV